MPHEIRIPRLGWSMEEGKFIGWLKQPGDVIRVGEPLFELESEKAVQPIESVDEGKLHIPPDSPAPDSVVAVGELLGYLLVAGEAIPDASASQIDETERAPVDPQTPRIETSTVAEAPRSSGPIASPRARRVATELGIDWKKLNGTGRDHRIRESDVRAVAKAPDPSPRVANPLSISPRRKAIAARLRQSRDRTVPVTLTTTADATNLVSLRAQFKAAQAPVVPAYIDVMACLVVMVLERHPRIAVNWDHDQRSLIAMTEAPFGIGIAVDTPDGLLVPVLRDVASKSLINVARETTALIERARSGRLSGGEMQGGVVTITNLGAWGIDAFTPIINYPEIAILGMGAIRRELVVLPDDRAVPRDRMVLSLTFDHAAIDGVPAADFLRDMAQTIENPAAHLLDESVS